MGLFINLEIQWYNLFVLDSVIVSDFGSNEENTEGWH